MSKLRSIAELRAFDGTLRVFLVQGLTSNMERSMKNVLNLLGTEMGRIRELNTLSKQI